MAKENYTPEEKKTLKKMFWNSRLVFSSFNMVKMEGNAFALVIGLTILEGDIIRETLESVIEQSREAIRIVDLEKSGEEEEDELF